MALPKAYETVARLGATSTTGDPEGEIARDRPRARPTPLVLPTGELRQRPPAYSAVQGRRPARVRAGARGRGRRAPRARGRRVYRFEQLWREGDRAAFAIECSAGTYVRVADRRPRRRLLRGAAAHGDRPVRASPTPTRERARAARATRWARSCPAVAWTGDDARRAAHGVAVRRSTAPARRRRARCCCSTPTGRSRSPSRGTDGGAEARRRLPRREAHALLPDAGAAAPRRVAVGTFDGVHLGHREVIARRRHGR